MSNKILVTDGEDFVVEHVDRAYGGARVEVIHVNDAGEVTIKGTEMLSGTVADDIELAADKNLSMAAGTGAVDLSLGTGTFKSTTGAHTLGGDTTVASGKDLLFAGGDSKADFSLGTGIFKSSTGANTLGGDTTVASGKDLLFAGGDSKADFSLGSGIFKTTTGLTTVGGDLLMAANKIVGFGAPQALTCVAAAGVADVTSLVTLVTSDGGAAPNAVSLADGTQAGQLKIIVFTVEVAGGDSIVVTPTTAGVMATLTLAALWDAGVLVWSGSAWEAVMATGTASFA